jgi:hypothetical protein
MPILRDNTDPEPIFNKSVTTTSHVKHYKHPPIIVTAVELIQVAGNYIQGLNILERSPCWI